MQPMRPIEIATAVIGAALGVVAAWTWQRVSAHLGNDHVWRKFAVAARSLVWESPDHPFLTHYFELSRALGAYVGKSLLAAVVAFSPVVVVLALLAPVAAEASRVAHVNDLELTFFVGLTVGSLVGWPVFKVKRN